MISIFIRQICGDFFHFKSLIILRIKKIHPQYSTMTLNGLSKFSTVTITSVAERQSLTHANSVARQIQMIWSWIKSQLYCKIEIRSFKPLVNTEKHPKYSWHVYILIYNLYTSTLLKIVKRLSLKHGIRSDNKKSIFWTFRFATKDLMFSSSFPFTKLF